MAVWKLIVKGSSSDIKDGYCPIGHYVLSYGCFIFNGPRLHCKKCLHRERNEKRTLKKGWNPRTKTNDDKFLRCGHPRIDTNIYIGHGKKFCKICVLKRQDDVRRDKGIPKKIFLTEEQRKRYQRLANGKYRANKRNAFVEHVDVDILYERDEGICYLCDKDINRDEVTIEHIIPLSKGGEHSYKNTAIAHRRCNSIKKDFIIDKLPKSLSK